MIFPYHEAFGRNIGWLSEYEQQLIRQKTVAIAGMGGVGGTHLLTCVRLGIENFHISDFDTFEVGNFNRQVGASLPHVQKEKAATLKKMALEINPNCQIKVFSKGVNEDNIHDFLDGVDVYIDGIDLFAMDARRLIFQQCASLNIPAVTAAPLGMGTAYMIFTESSMSFEAYFNLEQCSSKTDIVTSFAVGLSPTGLHRQYLMDESRVHFQAQKGPSTIMGCQLCAGVACTEALKILLNRGTVYGAPYVHQFDAYRNEYKRVYIPFGNKNPLQKLKIYMGKKYIDNLNQEIYPYNEDSNDPLDNILNLAKWAPAGHNEQLCHIDRKSDDDITITTDKISSPCAPHEKERTTLNMLGIFLETLDHSAAFYGYKILITEDVHHKNGSYVCSVKFEKTTDFRPHLGAYVKARFTDRRPYKTTPLTADQKALLENSLDKQYHIQWKETLLERWKVSVLNACATKLEVQHPDFYEDIKCAIQLDRKYSATGLPDRSFNYDVLTRYFIKKVLPHKKIYQVLNTKLAGFALPLLQINFIPDMFCGAHCLLTRQESDRQEIMSQGFIDQALQDGKMIQRFWLTATSLGLALQPTHIKLIFGREAIDKSAPYQEGKIFQGLQKIRNHFLKTHGVVPEKALFAARLGVPKDRTVYARSTRMPLK